VVQLGYPLVSDVVEANGTHDGEHGEEYICHRVAQGSKFIIIFLTCCVPDSKRNNLSVDHEDSAEIICKKNES
jgi:hypothetical protein